MNAASATRALAALAALASGHAQAELAQQALSAIFSNDYDSNQALSATAPKAVWRASLTPTYQLHRSQGLDSWSGRFGLRLEQSSDTTISGNRRDPSLSLSWNRAMPTGGFGLSGSYEQASTRVTELRDTGLVAADGSKSSTALSAHWSREFDGRNSLSLNGGHTDISYSGGGLSDYTTMNAQATLSHVMDERNEPYLSLSVSRYLPKLGGLTSNSYDLLAGTRRKFSEQIDLSARAGLNITHAQTHRSGWQGGFRLDYARDARTTLSLDLGRSVSASGLGGFVQADQYSANLRHALSDTANAGMDLAWRKNHAAGMGTTSQISLWASKDLAPLWGLRLAYLYKQRDGGDLPGASGQVLSLSLSYSHPDFSPSRI